MAIIRLDCNLNGGDSVTPNNELFYRIYGDIDAYAAPIHTTGTALGDANVTVNNDNVIITGVDGTTNTSFKIAAVDGAGNEGVLSDAHSGSIIVFQDDFAGTSLDPKWAKTNPNASAEFIQNDSMTLGGDGSESTGYLEDYIIGTSGYDISTISAISFDVVGANICLNSWWVGLSISTINDTQFYISAAPNPNDVGNVSLSAKNATVNVFDSFAVSADYSTTATFKIVYDGSVITFHVWDGTSSWTLLYTSDPVAFTGNFYPVVASRNFAGNTNKSTVDNIYVTETDFLTQYPI